MYLAFYGLAEKPFSITPDPRYLYLSERHAEALAHLVYGIDEAGGFIQLTGEVGTGKTTVIRSLLARAPRNAELALILNPRMEDAEFILTVCEELGIGVPDDALGSVKELSDILNRYLLRAHAEGRRVVLVVDEAQNLTPDLLEQVRMLTNLETESQKLLQIILIGQPELREVLSRHDLRQVAQRITGRYHLRPLSRAETQAYVKHRLRVAGATMDLFTNGALRSLYRVSGGVPRLINIIADRALLGGFTEDRHRITAAMVRKAASEVFDRRVLPAWLPWLAAVATAGVVTAGVVGVTLLRTSEPAAIVSAPKPPDAAPTAASAPPPAAEAATPPPPAGPRALTTVLHDERVRTDADTAFARLFALWNGSFQPGTEDACTQALRQGLECLATRGAIEQLRVFDRPALLELAEGERLHRVVLTTLDGDEAEVQFGTIQERVQLAELLDAWTGDFILLWRPPELDTRALGLGARGSTVQSLRTRLRRALGRPDDGRVNENFDSDLERDVREFQLQRGLGVDGVAGVQTQIALDAALRQPGTPVLQVAGSAGTGPG
jgi:general secretion pathway protein A